MDDLFFKVFRNSYLNFQIFKQLNFYKENYQVLFKSVDEIREYKYREYIQNINYVGDQVLKKGDLPENGILESIRIEKNDYLIDDEQGFFNLSPLVFPSSVKSISYPLGSINTTLVGLPESVTYVENVVFDKPVTSETIPYHITTLKWGFMDQQLTNGSIPSTIRKLHLGAWSNLDNQLQVGDISYGVQELCMGAYPSHPDHHYPNGAIPDSVTSLRINHTSFQETVDNETILSNRVLPNSVTNLFIESFNGCKIIQGFIPSSVTRLSLCGPSFTFEPLSLITNCNITFLYLNYEFDTPITIGLLPPNLKTLIICSTINIEHGSLPNGLEKFQYITNGGWKDDDGWNQKFTNGFFPNSLLHLDLGKSFNQTLEENDLPNGIQTLKFGKFFRSSISVGVLPSSITELDTGGSNSDTNSTLLKGAIPSSVITLSLSPGFSKSLGPDSIPSTVKTCYYYGDESPNISYIPNSTKLIHKEFKFELPIRFK